MSSWPLCKAIILHYASVSSVQYDVEKNTAELLSHIYSFHYSTYANEPYPINPVGWLLNHKHNEMLLSTPRMIWWVSERYSHLHTATYALRSISRYALVSVRQKSETAMPHRNKSRPARAPRVRRMAHFSPGAHATNHDFNVKQVPTEPEILI